MQWSRASAARSGTASALLLAALLWTGTAAAQGGPLQVRRISPSGTGVKPAQEAVIQFDRVMVPLGHMGRKPSALPVTVSPDPGCQWRWLNTSELACRLPKQQHFAPATHYTVTVGTKLQALDGSHLPKPLVRTFTTRLPHVDYSRFQKWLSPVMPVFMVRVNLRVTAKQLAAHIGFDDSDGQRVATRVEPFTKKRKRPLWLPVPGVPGAAIVVDHPRPDTPLDAEASAAQGRRVWKVMPASPLTPATEYELSMQPGLRSPLGPLPGTQGDAVAHFKTYGAFAFAGIDCTNSKTGHDLKIGVGDRNPPRCQPKSINLRFSAPVPRATLAAIRWQPMPVLRAKLAKLWQNYPPWFLRDRRDSDASARGYPLTFGLDPMASYTLTVPAGVKDRFGRTLAQPVTLTFRTGHRVPFVDLPPHESVLETGEPTIVPLRFTNLDRLSFRYQRLTVNDLVRGTAPAPATTTNLLERPDLKAPEDQVVSGKLGIRKLLDSHPGALWGMLDWAPNGPYAPFKFMGEVTPWQVLAKVGHYDTLVWINRWDDSESVAGAKVKVLYGHGYDLGHLTRDGDVATTNAEGLAVLPGVVDWPRSKYDHWKQPPSFYVAATRHDAMALLPLDYSFQRSVGDASHYDIWSDTEPPHGHMRAWAVTEDGIYKPGSEVRYALFVRAQGSTTLKAPPRLDYTLTITDPQGNKVLTRKQVKLDAYGGTHGKLHIARTAPMGWYGIQITWPTGRGTASREAGRFLVTDFVPTAFKVSTQVQGTAFHPGARVKVNLAATLHAGGPYTDAKTRITTRLVAERFTPDTPIAAGFRFGDFTQSLPKAKTLAIVEGELDHTGHTQTAVALPAKSPVVHGEVKVEGAVQSARGKWIANDASVPYLARDRFVGLRTDDWMQTAGKPFKVDYLVVDSRGMPAAGSKVNLTLKRKTITRVKVKNGAGEFSNEQHVSWVAEGHCEAVSGKAPGSCELTPVKAGRYRVVATVTDTHGKAQRSVLPTWVTGAGWVTWSTSGKGVTLVPDQASYHVGDVAHVLVQNPYPGARALVTVERYGVLWKKVVTLQGSAPVINVPIKSYCFPGAYLSVAIFSPRQVPPADPDLGRPEVALGYIPLKVVGKGSSLAVKVTPARAQYKPRQTVNVDVEVRAKGGKAPGKTRLVVAVLDQGVFDLLKKGIKYYDPRATFYAPPNGPDIINYSLANQLLTRLQPKAGKGESPGGGGGESVGPNLRSNFKSAVYWNPDLETDASGHAQFSFKLPDNLTRWRILVIALSPGAAMGLGDGSVRVNLSLQIQPALPNQIRVGDRFGAAFNVTNRTHSPLHVTTHIAASGALDGGQAEARHALDLASFGHGLSWLDLHAAEPGDITLTATARVGKLGDAVRAHIPVRLAGTEVVAAEYGSTTGSGARVPVKVPAKAVPDSGKVVVRFAPTLVGGLDGAFSAMRDDPLRTWEVRLSRGVLASDYLRLKPALGDSVTWKDAAGTIGKTLDAAADFQAPNGGMAFWVPRDKFVSPYLSVYTALAFDWLDAAGHPPPERVRKRLWDYLHKEILAKHGDESAAPVLRAGALAALAMAKDGRLPKGAVAGMLPKLHQMRLFGQALLLEAAVANGDRTSADGIAKSLLNHSEESAGEISFNQHEEGVYLDLLATPLRSNCAILDALSRYHTAYGNENLVGNVPQKLMRWVAAQRSHDGAWPNSQENVFCTTATTHYADAYETPVKALTGTLELPGRKPASTTFASRATPAVKLAGPAARPGQQFHVKLSRSGQGRLYYGVRVHYTMPPGSLPAADAGMTLSRRYYVQRGTAWKPVTTGSVLKRGDIVLVSLDVDAPTERHHVVLTDPLPGAFEAVNRNLATAPTLAPAKQPGVSVLMFNGGAWPNMSIVSGGFYHRETGFDAVRFFADDLPAGHYVVAYSVQVIAPGSFTAPAPEIKEIYQPDVFGRGVTQHVQVAMPGP